MCGKLNIEGKVYIPGNRFRYNVKGRSEIGTWGIGPAYNARIENISSTWRNISNNRGILAVNGFYERSKYIVNEDGELMLLGLLYDNNHNFVIITKPPQPLIKLIHNRQPLLIEQDRVSDWILEGNLDYDKEFPIKFFN